MEASVNTAHLETKISRPNCKDRKKQGSLRCHMVSGFLAMVEMLHALRSLWEVLFPFVVLWWNAMLCATCARYYSWNRPRFCLQWAGHQFHGDVMGDADAEETRDKDSLLSHQSEDGSYVEMKVPTCCHSGSCQQTSCVQEMELGSHLFLSTQDANDGMFLHDALVDSSVMHAEDHYDNLVEELKLEDSILSNAHVSKALEISLPSSTSKISFLHFPDERSTQQFGLLKAAYWSACPFLLPQQVAPLAMYCKEMNFMDVKVPMQLLRNIYIQFSTLEEHLQMTAASFVSRILSMIHCKEHAYLARKILKCLLARRGCSIDDDIMRLALALVSSLHDLNLARSLRLSEGNMENLERHPSSSQFSDVELKSDDDRPLHNGDEDVSADEGSVCGNPSLSYDGYNRLYVSGSQSNFDSNDNFNDGNAVQGSQMDVDIVYPASSQRVDCEENDFDSGKEVGFHHESSIHLNDNYHDLYDRSPDWDVKYGSSYWFQEADSVYGGYYDTGDGVSSDYAYFDGSFESDDAMNDGSNYVDNSRVHGNQSEVKHLHLLDTWWDEDAVLVGKQDPEEDSMEQAWHVL